METQTPSPVTERPGAKRPKDAAAYLGIGTTTLYALIKAGEIPTIKIGAATLITVADLDAFLERKRAESQKAAA